MGGYTILRIVTLVKCRRRTPVLKRQLQENLVRPFSVSHYLKSPVNMKDSPYVRVRSIKLIGPNRHRFLGNVLNHPAIRDVLR
jgi:hypothetical protein